MAVSLRPADLVADLLAGHRVTGILCAAIELGVIEALASEPRTVAEIASECAVHEESCSRLLVALSGADVCRAANGGRYELTDIGMILTTRAETSLRDWALFEGKSLARSWLGLADSVRSGKTASELSGSGDGRFAELERDYASATLFDSAMVSMSRLIARDVLAAYDFNGAGRVLDVGGGTGSLLIEILLACPSTSGCVLELPRCEAAARRNIAAANLAKRADFRAGDFFAEVPTGFDTLVLKSVLHNWDDARCQALLRNCRRALGAFGKLIIVERLLSRDEDDRHRLLATALSDLNMLRGPGGYERSESTYRSLAANAGLRIVDVREAGRFALVVAQCEAEPMAKPGADIPP